MRKVDKVLDDDITESRWAKMQDAGLVSGSTGNSSGGN